MIKGYLIKQAAIKNVYLILLTFSVIVMLIISNRAITYKIQELKNELFISASSDLKKELDAQIKAKSRGAISIALALSENDQLKKYLTGEIDYESVQTTVHSIVDKLHDYTDYKNVWLHLINSKGVSVARSWNEKHGDTLVNIRLDIKDMISNPKIMTTISVGKFAMTFKSMVPIYNKTQFIGMVEIITHFNSIAQSFKVRNIESIVLVDKRYRQQLTKSITNVFIDEYNIANFNVDSYYLRLLQKYGVEYFTQIDGYKIVDNFLVVCHHIEDIKHEPMGYYILFKKIDDLDFVKIDIFVHSLEKWGVAVLIFLMSISVLLYRNRQKIHFQKEYYHQIIDTAAEIIVVTDLHQPLDVNYAFFQFFTEFKILKEFQAIHGCICNLFVQEEGFVYKDMGELSWVEYIVTNQVQKPKAKIVHNGIATIFSIKARRLNEENGTYTLVLSDITEQELQKHSLEKLAWNDYLTQIGNRAYYYKSLSQEIGRSQRHHKALSMIMFDIDYFKSINDTHGHTVGDQVLVELSRTILRCLRIEDIFCRYGGEEFIVILPETDEEEAFLIAERLRVGVELNRFSMLQRSLTISLGVAQYKGQTLETFQKIVDRALYDAKVSGRNRTIIAS